MEPIRLLALATELDKEGQYNIAKTLRAAAESLLLRASTTEVVPSSPADQAAALEDIATRLESTVGGALSAPLRAAAEALRSGGVPMHRDTPDPRVCRICGEVRLEAFDARCSHCGRWPGAERRHRAIYWLRASTPPEALALLAHTPTVVKDIMEGGRADVSGPDGGWTAAQTLEHLHNAQSVFRGRIDQLLDGGEPELASVMVWKMDAEEVTAEALLDDYLALRSEIVERLTDAPADAWWHTGSHEEFGVVSLAEQASYFANHEPTHLAQIADAAAQ
jgi:ribosomal protein L37E